MKDYIYFQTQNGISLSFKIQRQSTFSSFFFSFVPNYTFTMQQISGHIVDILNRTTFEGTVSIKEDGLINSIEKSQNVPDQYILPGFIDSHIHIESSMVTPYEFAKVALRHGTVATISDPHEIANVCGINGVQYMIDNARDAKLKFHFGAPSCVPATSFENAGATITAEDIEVLMQNDDIWYLSEMMNYPGVLANDAEILKKIASAKKYNKPVDGHAPGLMGLQAKEYISHGITTDHECTTLSEALDKLRYGMKVIIREGSAAKNYEALHSLIASHTDMGMFCSDDKHPDDLLEGHINALVKRSVDLGYDVFDVLKIACINPILHYNIPVGYLRPNDPGDFIVVKDLTHFEVIHTFINGQKVSDGKTSFLPDVHQHAINNFKAEKITAESLKVAYSSTEQPIIMAIDGSLITEKIFQRLPKGPDESMVCDPENDILKICVVNRYQNAKPACGFIKNFGLKHCAIASTVAHDSHNIVAVGSDDELLAKAINALVDARGGLSAVTIDDTKVIPLPIAGLMSDQSAEIIGNQYKEITAFAHRQGCQLHAPYMTLSFMALLVIPKIKMSDLGMFDAERFEFY
jgi:adenine deaminase